VNKFSFRPVNSLEEAKYWLSLIGAAEVLPLEVISGLMKEAGELGAILSQLVMTAKARLNGTSDLSRNTLDLRDLLGFRS
jgi:hypothetical protein